MIKATTVSILAIALAACSSEPAADGSGLGEPMHGDYDEDYLEISNGTAEQMGLSCDEDSSSEPDQQDNIQGVYIGMKAEDAFKEIACANPLMTFYWQGKEALPGYQFPDAGYYDTQLPGGGYAYSGISGTTEASQINISLAGEPGNERVIHMERTVRFDEKDRPSLESLKNQVEAKYKIRENIYGGNDYWGAKVFSADGVELVKKSSGVDVPYNRCSAKGHLRETCGLYVKVNIGRAENPLMATTMNVVIQNGSYGIRQIGLYEKYARNLKQEVQQREAEKAEIEANDANGVAADL